MSGELSRLQGYGRGALLAATAVLTGAVVEVARAQDPTVGLAVVTGRVVDHESGDPIDGVNVRLIEEDTEFQRSTNDRGLFVFPRVPPGTYELVLEHPSYGTRADTIEVLGREIVDFAVELAVQPIVLAPVVVSVRRQYVSPTMQEFYERMDKGLGHFITRADIQRRQPGRITHMIADAPGVSLVAASDRGTAPRVHFRRHQRYIQGRAVPCWPTVYVDGRRIQEGGPDMGLGPFSEVNIDELILPGDVEGVEVYDGAGGVPARFGGSWGGCGVVAIWTRSAP